MRKPDVSRVLPLPQWFKATEKKYMKKKARVM